MEIQSTQTNDLIRVIIADDHEIVRIGLKRFLSFDQNIHVVAEASNGEDAILLVKTHVPDILLLDINMPKIDGIKVAYEIRKLYPNLKIVMLSAHEDSFHLEKALQAGANGYLSKEIEVRELLPAIYSVLRDERVFSRSILELVHRNSLSVENNNTTFVSLTRREQEILGMVSNGMASIEIAEKLSISPRTVDTHRYNLITKFGVKNTAQLVSFALLNRTLS